MSASHGAISAVLMTERDMVQTPIYFVSCTLQGPELNYTPMEKLVLALILAEFLIEKLDEASPDTSVVETPQEPWILFTDGSLCVDGSGAGLILTSLEGTEFTYALRFHFTASNNEAEYEALIDGLRIAEQMGVNNVHMSINSKLVANQVLGTYVAKEENMIKYLEKAKSMVLVEVLKEKSIQEKEVATVVEEYGPTWMTPIMKYLKDGTLRDDRKEASKLRIKARQYKLLEGVLYRRSFVKPWLRTTVHGGQSHAIGILLANHASGFTGCDMKMKGQVFDSRYGLFCKVDRDESRGNNHRQSEAVIPAEIRMPTYRTVVVDAVHNDEELQLNLDLLEERREHAAICEANAKLKMTKKLGQKWEGPYEVTEALRDGAYMLRSMDETVLPRT
nr:reverse transcriptase domain-containing protein [Tanacetum cinerariifolium]